MKWKPGQSGNPNGRPPKSRAFSDELRRLLLKKAPGSRQTNLEVIVAKFVELAREGDKDAIRYLADRLEGKPAQAVELTGDERRPLRIIYAKGSEEK